MAKTLLIVSGGIEAAGAVKRAREMGHYVVVSDSDYQAPAVALADSCLIADVHGASETAAAAERFSRKIRKIDGVICVGADAAMTAATVAKRLGLPGISLAAAELASDRLALRRRFVECGIPVPWFSEVETPQALQRIAVERGPDLLIKPVDGHGSRGIQHVAQVADLSKAFMFARAHSPSERVMVEQYLQGPRVSTESIVMDGKCFTPGLVDRNYENLERFAPFIVEDGGDLPSRLPETLLTKVRDVVASAAAALGLTHGTLRGDIVVHEGEVFVNEMSPRLSGDFFCTHLHSGVDVVGAAIKIALGDQVSAEDLIPKHGLAVIQRYAFPKAGEVVSVAGVEDARRIAGVNDVILTAKPGDIIPAAGDERPSAAMVLTSGTSRDAALRAANDALNCLKFAIK
ncbi:MAG TPA: ATP-grasp domain-containing protein [Rhizomicrobium sp.]|nr:ATP-grasp domain-containing protein [Rhizomicrobium sp.]